MSGSGRDAEARSRSREGSAIRNAPAPRYHDFALYCPLEFDGDDKLVGFEGSIRGELRLYDDDVGAVPTATILHAWHASKNWI